MLVVHRVTLLRHVVRVVVSLVRVSSVVWILLMVGKGRLLGLTGSQEYVLLTPPENHSTLRALKHGGIPSNWRV